MSLLEDLPLLPLERVAELLDYRARRIGRLVSRKIKLIVDEIGLSVLIDSRNAQSMTLSNRVNATEARVLYLKGNDLQPEVVTTWRTAIISGPVDNTWLNDRMLRNCFNLRILIINQGGLISSDLELPAEPLPRFHHLNELHLCLNQVDPSRVPEELPYWGLMPQEMLSRIEKNVIYFLSAIRSRNLKLVHVAALMNESQLIEPTLVTQPLFDFLAYHRQNLETIILPNLWLVESIVNTEIPVQLKGILLTPKPTETFRTHNLSTYWRSLIVNQGSLEKLFILNWCLDLQPFPWLGEVVSNNARSLTHIHLGIPFGNEHHGFQFQATIDIGLLRVLESLQSLNINAYNGITIQNLNDLPIRSLITLKLISANISADFDGKKFLESSNRLRYLHLTKISHEGYFNDPQYVFRFIKAGLRCRNMDYFIFSLTAAEASSGQQPEHDNAFLDVLQLEPWIFKLDDAEFPHVSAFNFRNEVYSNWLDLETETLWHVYSDMDFMELMHMQVRFAHIYHAPPFYFNRNAKSFSIWRTRGLLRFLENKKSYSETINELKGVRISFKVALEKDDHGNTSFVGQAALLDLGVSIDAFPNTSNKKWISLRF